MAVISAGPFMKENASDLVDVLASANAIWEIIQGQID